jgi:hypothetical protein
MAALNLAKSGMMRRMSHNSSDRTEDVNDAFQASAPLGNDSNVDHALIPLAFPERRQRAAKCEAPAMGDTACRALPRYVCLSFGGAHAGHELCGVHVVRTGLGFRCPLCGSLARPFRKRKALRPADGRQ